MQDQFVFIDDQPKKPSKYGKFKFSDPFKVSDTVSKHSDSQIGLQDIQLPHDDYKSKNKLNNFAPNKQLHDSQAKPLRQRIGDRSKSRQKSVISVNPAQYQETFGYGDNYRLKKTQSHRQQLAKSNFVSVQSGGGPFRLSMPTSGMQRSDLVNTKKIVQQLKAPPILQGTRNDQVRQVSPDLRKTLPKSEFRQLNVQREQEGQLLTIKLQLQQEFRNLKKMQLQTLNKKYKQQSKSLSQHYKDLILIQKESFRSMIDDLNNLLKQERQMAKQAIQSQRQRLAQLRKYQHQRFRLQQEDRIKQVQRVIEREKQNSKQITASMQLAKETIKAGRSIDQSRQVNDPHLDLRQSQLQKKLREFQKEKQDFRKKLKEKQQSAISNQHKSKMMLLQQRRKHQLQKSRIATQHKTLQAQVDQQRQKLIRQKRQQQKRRALLQRKMQQLGNMNKKLKEQYKQRKKQLQNTKRDSQIFVQQNASRNKPRSSSLSRMDIQNLTKRPY